LDGALARLAGERTNSSGRPTLRRLARGLIGALAVTLAVVAPATADTAVSVDGSMNLVVTGNADPSTVTITESGTNAFTVADPAGDVTATAPCTGGGATVSCAGVTGAIMAHGNGGDDSITVAPTTTRRAFLYGEAGADKLTGGAGADQLRDDFGIDELRGGDNNDDLQDCGPEDDLLMGEGGNDVIQTCIGSSKQLIGGPGDDFFSANVVSGRVDFVGGDGVDGGFLFAQMSGWRDVSVSLDDQANDGPAGGTSNVHSDVEDVFTAGGSDTITGSAGPNTIRSDASANGYGFSNALPPGNDTIDPGGGADRVYAGGGDDTIMARDQTADVVNCGSNIASPLAPALPPVDSDTVTADSVDTFVSCENVLTTAGTSVDHRPPVVKITAPAAITTRAFRRGLKVKLSADEPASFAAELRAKVKRRHGALAFAGAVGELTIGQGRLKLGAGTRSLNLRASAKLAKAVRGRALRLVVRVVATDAAGNEAEAARKVRVKRRSR
jgi:RTX calcium-binding nonapeptide repeat (4 copies)